MEEEISHRSTDSNHLRQTVPRIIVADDLVVNIALIEHSAQQIGIIDRVKFCSNGQEVIDAAMSMIDEELRVKGSLDEPCRIQPIQAMFLDL